jgi:hypothetical protein
MTKKGKLLTGLAAAGLALVATGAVCGGNMMPGMLYASGEPNGGGAGAATGTKAVTIRDPNLNMTAYSMTIPSDWMFQGAVIQGSNCVPGAFAVFRVNSPDGLYGIKMLPRLDWAWSDNPQSAPKPGASCLPYKQEIPASQVMKYMVGVLKVEYVKDEPTPNLENMRRNAAAHNTPQFITTVDMANGRVRYHINSLVIDEVLNVGTSCSSFKLATPGRQHMCSAYVTRSWAPQGKYSTDIFHPISQSFTLNQEWNQRWNAVMVQRIKEISEQGSEMIRRAGAQNDQRMAAQHSAFMQAQDMRQRQHEEFMASIQRGTDMSMQRTGDAMNARSRAADDWADYALDQQKRLDPNTGVITKDSSAYSYTWVNQFGKRIQTNNINDNPNGNGTGNWTLQENVH